jgi:AraC-like DNA-binding protein
MHESAVAVPYVRLLFEFLHREGLDPEAVLGCSEAELDEREQLPLAHWRDWLERTQAAVSRPALGLAVGRLITPAHLGVLGYMVLHCAHLAQALARMERYHRLVYDVNPARWRSRGEDVLVEWGTERGRPGQLVDETGVAAMVQFTRDITRNEPELREVWFVNPAPARLEPYETFFGCPVHFEQPCTRLRFAGEVLAAPLRRPDAKLLALLDEQAEALLTRFLEDRPEGDPGELWRRQLVTLLRQGEASLGALARVNHVSTRTLQRRLAQAGTSFQALLDETRRALAFDYLRDGRLEMAEIAQLLGFSEQSAFTRAFRNWTGDTPGRWRQRG